MEFKRIKYKTDAKLFLKGNYLKAFGISLIMYLFSGSVNLGNLINYNYEDSDAEIFSHSIENYSPTHLDYIEIIFIIFAIILLVKFLIGSIVCIKGSGYFLSNNPTNYSFFYNLKHNYSKIVSTMFMMYLKIFVGTLFFIIPGIIFAYKYRFVPYILVENPNLSVSEILLESTRITEGHKIDLYIMDLSFLGWLLLGGLFFGVGGLFVAPYIEKSFANAYLDLKPKYLPEPNI